MTFTRPSNITITQMAQWVDANYMLADCDRDKLVEYLYHLSMSRAKQMSLFNDNESYDDFSIFCVTKILLRMENPEELKVKSISNYLKAVMSPWQKEYIRFFCSGSPDLEIHDFDVNDFSDYLVDSTSVYDTTTYSFYSFRVADVIIQHLRKIPRRKKSSEWSNICTSCLLTLHNRVKSAVGILNSDVINKQPHIANKVIRNLKTKPPILFHLDESMSTYISVLVNEIIHAIAAELTYSTGARVSVSTCLKNLVAAASNCEDE